MNFVFYLLSCWPLVLVAPEMALPSSLPSPRHQVSRTYSSLFLARWRYREPRTQLQDGPRGPLAQVSISL